MFGQSSAAPSGGSSLFAGLNLATDQPTRRRSIFDASTSIPHPQSQAPSMSSLGGSTLFGGASTSNPSLFHSNPAGAPPTGSLFAPAATSAPTSNLFGTTTTTAAPTSTLFGASNTPAAPTSTLFGNNNSSAAPSGGLFSNQSTDNTQRPAAPTSFGSLAPPGSQPGASSSIFGTNAGHSISQPALSLHGSLIQSQTRDPAHFSSLLERQKKRVRFATSSENARLNQIPSLNMDLGDMARRAQEIGGRGTPTKNGNDSRAHYLLAGSGVVPGSAYRDFEALNRDSLAGDDRPPAEPFNPENSGYVRDLQQKGKEAMMKESMERVYREVDTFIEESLGIDFEEQKQRIMEHFGLVAKDEEGANDARASPTGRGSFGRSRKSKNGFADPGNVTIRSVFGRSALDQSLIGNPTLGGSASFFGGDGNAQAASTLLKGQTARDLRDKERLFVEQVETLNQARLQDISFPIMLAFGDVEETAGGDSPKQLVDAYEALSEIIQGTPQAPIKERQYASVYLDDHSASAQAVKLRRQVLDGSRTYLENAFYRELELLVEKNPREAQLGGRPSVVNKVRAYIRVRAARRDLAPDGAELQQIGDSEDYCWILIFYLLRSGFVREAAEYVNNDPAFQSTDKRFVSYLTTYASSPDRKLSRKLQDMINGEYQQRLRIAPEHSVDPYRMACYKVVGRCDLSRRNLDAVGQGVEDWIWLQFNLARESDRLEEYSGDIFGLEQICETITEIGQKHFQKGQVEGSGGYGTYFLMQILAGMFEHAVDFLHQYNPVSAVHFAIALAYSGLLRVADYSTAGNELLAFSTTQKPLINFVPLIAYYTAAFRTALPLAAVDYLALICLNSDLKPGSLGTAQTNACHECLRQLCLETRDFAKLLGDIHNDGSRIAGAIEQKGKLIKLDTHDDFLKAVTSQAASIADERGQIADAVLLYHLCEDYDNVVSILNRSLADCIALDLGESPMQLQPLKPRRDEAEQNGSQASNMSQSSLSLTQSTASPVALAQNMISLYNANAEYYQQISKTNRETVGVLLQLLSVREHLESMPPRFMPALEELNSLNILPLSAAGSIPTIRSAASAFGVLPHLLARCAGISVVWAVRAIGGERENLMRHGSWTAEGGVASDRDSMKDVLSQMAKDLMVFAGLVKYKLPGRVYDMLTRAGGDVGSY